MLMHLDRTDGWIAGLSSIVLLFPEPAVLERLTEHMYCTSTHTIMSTSQFTQGDDLIAIWRHYVHVLLSPAAGEDDPASKALVADEQAMRMITLACPMTFLTEYRVYDVRSLEQMVDALEPQSRGTGRETVCQSARDITRALRGSIARGMKTVYTFACNPPVFSFIQAYVLLRPTPQSQDNFTKLLQKDLFAAYHLSAPPLPPTSSFLYMLCARPNSISSNPHSTCAVHQNISGQNTLLLVLLQCTQIEQTTRRWLQ